MSALISTRSQQTRDRLQSLAIRARTAIGFLRSWVMGRIAEAREDERGLTTAEYVALGALVVVAAGAVGAVIANFIATRGNQIISTP